MAEGSWTRLARELLSLRDPASITIDEPRLRQARLARLREELARLECAGCVLLDPVNIRYACGARNMQVFMLRNPARYLFVAVDGPVVLHEFEGCHHLARGLETIDEIRPAITASFVAAGEAVAQQATAWAREVIALATDHGSGNRRLAVERVHPAAVNELERAGFELIDAQQPVERARARKTPEELPCILASISATEGAVERLEHAIQPGRSEQQVWAELHHGVVENDGDYIETRLFNAGSRTFPWFRECSPHRMQSGDLVCLDTDVVGPHGYYADFSRSFLCGDVRPTPRQGELYRLAWEQVHENVRRLRPGMGLREYSHGAWKVPAPHLPYRYYVLAHGVGMTGEYPYILHELDYRAGGYDGVIEPGMTLCVESYIGDPGTGQGVKLEQQVLVTERDATVLSRFPFDERLLGRAL